MSPAGCGASRECLGVMHEHGSNGPYGSNFGSTGWKGRTQIERNCTGLP